MHADILSCNRNLCDVCLCGRVFFRFMELLWGEASIIE